MTLRVGLCYDRFGDAPRPPGAPPDWDAEYEPEETVAALEAAVRRLGHAPVRLGNAQAVLKAMPDLEVDVAVNIAARRCAGSMPDSRPSRSISSSVSPDSGVPASASFWRSTARAMMAETSSSE